MTELSMLLTVTSYMQQWVDYICMHADVAEMVLNGCTVERSKPGIKDYREGKDYEVLFNYEFIEDYHDDSIA